MGSYELSLSGFINEVKEVSEGPHPRKFCFVLGAGSSISSGIKSGQELVEIWDRELEERNRDDHLRWKKELCINDTNKYSFYSKFYERRYRRHPEDGYNFLEKLMQDAKPQIGYVMLSYLLSRTNHNVVVTTNFDHLTEDAVNYYARTIPLIIGHESLAYYITRQIRRPTIIKIHRDLLFDPKNTEDEVEVLHDNWKKALGNVFAEYNPVFIGYAGNDNSLMNFLIDNSNKFMDGEWKSPYWMFYKTEVMSEKVLKFLDGSDGCLIRHSGFDEVLILFGAAFDYKLPPREDFLKDAEERYQMLTNSIDEFNEKSAGVEENDQNEEDGAGKNAEELKVDQAISRITDQAEMQRLYRNAVMLNNAGNYKEAIQLERKLIEMNPENGRYHYALGFALNKINKCEEAINATQEAIRLDSDNAKYYNSLGTILHGMRRYKEALMEKQKAVDLDPDNVEYRQSLEVTRNMVE